MADKKISEFKLFDGVQDKNTYYIIASGSEDSGLYSNFKVPFTDLVSGAAPLISQYITGNTGSLGSGIGEFLNEYLDTAGSSSSAFELDGSILKMTSEGYGSALFTVDGTKLEITT